MAHFSAMRAYIKATIADLQPTGLEPNTSLPTLKQIPLPDNRNNIMVDVRLNSSRLMPRDRYTSAGQNLSAGSGYTSVVTFWDVDLWKQINGDGEETYGDLLEFVSEFIGWIYTAKFNPSVTPTDSAGVKIPRPVFDNPLFVQQSMLPPQQNRLGVKVVMSVNTLLGYNDWEPRPGELFPRIQFEPYYPNGISTITFKGIDQMDLVVRQE